MIKVHKFSDYSDNMQADLPDLLSSHCLSIWMKCLFDKWNNVA